MEKADELAGHSPLSLLQLRLMLPFYRGGVSEACVWRPFTITEGAFWSYWESKIICSLPTGHGRCSLLLLTWITTPQKGVYSCLGIQWRPAQCGSYWRDICCPIIHPRKAHHRVTICALWGWLLLFQLILFLYCKSQQFFHIYPCAFDCRIPNFTKEDTKRITH